MMRAFDAQDSDKKYQETMQSLDTLDAKVEKLLERQEKVTHAEFLRWLCHLDPIADHEFFLEETGTLDNFSKRGLWLFQSNEYESWVHPTSPDESVLRIQGSMGTGKTTLTTLSVE
jgi:hypothetical protein